jgi:two-component system, LytTR family, sensor kinase
MFTMFSHKYRYLFITLLAVYTYLNTVFCQIYGYFNIDIHWYYALGVIFFITLGTWEGSRLIEPLFIKATMPGRRESQRRFMFFFILGTVISIFMAVIAVLVMGVGILGFSLSSQFIPLKLTITYATLANLLFHLVNAIFHYFRQYQSKQLEAEELKRINVQAQLQAVNSQINPHFLFNNLNVLSGLVLTDAPEANRFTEAFSQVYRYILSNRDKELVEVSEEIEFIRPYLFLLQKRFPNGIQVNLEVSEQARRLYIVPVALQMLIENAIKHNIAIAGKPLQIDIRANGKQELSVWNNLQPKKNREPSSSIGLQNINKRYELLFQKQINIVQNENSFSVTLPLIKVERA